jgi:hypothetical protein
MPTRSSLALLAWVASAGLLSAQAAPAPSAGAMPDAHLLVLGGATLQRTDGGIDADPPPPHLALGLTAGAARQGWGLLALAMGGRGGDHHSTLLGGAASRRVARGAGWSLLLFGGYGIYGERGYTGIERDAPGFLFGATARWRVGPLTLAGVYSHLTGSYDETDVVSPFRFHVPRFSLGVGF